MRTKYSITILGVLVALLSMPVVGCNKGDSSSAGSSTEASGARSWKAGDKVDVEWNGSWWQGEILEVKGGKYKVHYTGWSSSWDEMVDSKRLRPPTGAAKKGTEK